MNALIVINLSLLVVIILVAVLLPSFILLGEYLRYTLERWIGWK